MGMRYEKGTFTTVPNKYILRGKEPHTQVVYFWICDYADESGLCFPSLSRLAEDAKISRNTAIKAVDELVDLGLLTKHPRKDGVRNLTNVYQLHILEGGSAGGALGSAGGALGGSAPGGQRTKPTLLNSIQLSSRISSSKKSVEPSEEDITPELDIDLVPISLRQSNKGREPKNKVAFDLQRKFQDMARSNVGTAPIVNKNGYFAIIYAMNTGKLTPSQIESLFEEHFDQPKKDEELMSITRALSANSINSFKVRNGL